MRRRVRAGLAMTLACVGSAACAQTVSGYAETRRAVRRELDAIASAPKPRTQDDLDTGRLASAHRERAESMQERTNGLWQSWLVSICEGCGPQMLSYKQRGLAASGETADAGSRTVPALVVRRTATAPTSGPTRLAGVSGDLSPGNVDRIRRRPVP